MLKVYTSNMRYQGKDKLDITVKSGDKAFAPTWDMVMGLKNDKITEQEYTDQYTYMMALSFKRNKAKWDKLLSLDSITLCCYCKPGTFCHRVLLAKILETLGAKYIGERM
jgi:uncharacterized protein YeaO (DUF488 family)